MVPGCGGEVTHCCVSKLIHDDRDAETMMFCKDALEESRFSCTKKAADDGKGHFRQPFFIVLYEGRSLLFLRYQSRNLVVVHERPVSGRAREPDTATYTKPTRR